MKGHLDQLDQQISELKLDVGKTSIEYLDSDSRPSSGNVRIDSSGNVRIEGHLCSYYLKNTLDFPQKTDPSVKRKTWECFIWVQGHAVHVFSVIQKMSSLSPHRLL